MDIPTILMISTIIIILIRITAYYKESLSRELARILPFTILAFAIIQKGLFNFQEIFVRFTQLSSLFQNILWYIATIVLVEIILRVFDFIFSLFDLEDKIEEEEEKEVKKARKKEN
jgi:phosphotransferase system  glucose/maltose/N-acetylglucosamine-specific IIC component